MNHPQPQGTHAHGFCGGPATSPPLQHSVAPGQVGRDRRMASAEQLVSDLVDWELRENALAELSKVSYSNLLSRSFSLSLFSISMSAISNVMIDAKLVCLRGNLLRHFGVCYVHLMGKRQSWRDLSMRKTAFLWFHLEYACSERRYYFLFSLF